MHGSALRSVRIIFLNYWVYVKCVEAISKLKLKNSKNHFSNLILYTAKNSVAHEATQSVTKMLIHTSVALSYYDMMS